MLTCLSCCSLPFCPARGSPSLPGVGMGGTAGWGVTLPRTNTVKETAPQPTGCLLIAFMFPVFEPQITPGPLAQPLVGFLWK